jgi:hypothetical protein
LRGKWENNILNIIAEIKKELKINDEELINELIIFLEENELIYNFSDFISFKYPKYKSEQMCLWDQ